MWGLSAADWVWCQAHDPGSTRNYTKFRVKMLGFKCRGSWSLGLSDIQVGMTILVL